MANAIKERVESSQVHVHNHNHIESDVQSRSRIRRIGKYAVAAVAGGAVVAAFLIPAGSSETGTITQAEVVKIAPQKIDQRAVVEAYVGDKIHKTPSVGLLGKIASLTGTSSLYNRLMNTYGTSASFVGANGKGGGEIISYVDVKTTGVHTEYLGNGKQVIEIPAGDISFNTKPNEANSEVIHGNGDLYGIGKAEWNTLPFGFKDELEQQEAQLGQVARVVAENEMQKSCDKVAWPQTVKAMTEAYREIAQYDYSQQVSNGAHLAPFNAQNISLDIVGQTPKFVNAYDVNRSAGLTLEQSSASTCKVAPHALQLHGNT